MHDRRQAILRQVQDRDSAVVSRAPMAQKGGAPEKTGPSLSKNLLSMKFMQRGTAIANSGEDDELWGGPGARKGPDIGPMTLDTPPVGRRSFLGHRSQPVPEPPSSSSAPSTPAASPVTPTAASANGPGSTGKTDFGGRPLFKRLSTMSPPTERPNKAQRSLPKNE